MNQKLKPFYTHGVTLSISGNEGVGNCVLCGKEGHFFVSVSTGQWSCKHCHTKGNIPVFLQKLHEVSFQNTSMEHYQRLAKMRNLLPATLKKWKVARNLATGEWMIPMYNSAGKLANLGIYKKIEGKFRVVSTAGCTLHPYRRVEIPTKGRRFVYLCEGPWDAMALDELLHSIQPLKGGRYKRTTFASKTLGAKSIVYGIPGAGSFKDDWLYLLPATSHVHVLYDNDHPKKTPSGVISQPGWDGVQIVKTKMAKAGIIPRTLEALHWGNDKAFGRNNFSAKLPDHYDIGDLIKDRKPLEAWSFIQDNLQEISVPVIEPGNENDLIEPIECTSFKDLLAYFHNSHLHITQSFVDCLTVALATCISTEYKGDQIFLRIIGPPGSGKTTIAEALSPSSKYVYSRSTFTGFHSGFIPSKKGANKAKKGDEAKQLSPLAHMNGKTVIVKDADTILSDPAKAKILAGLRDIQDGSSRISYRNQQESIFEDLRITMILCGTDNLRSLNRSSLGDRFLDADIFDECDTQPYLDCAVDGIFATFAESLESEDTSHKSFSYQQVQQATKGFLTYLKDNWKSFTLPTASEKAKKTLKNYAQLLAYMRARPAQDNSQALHKPRVELATRLLKQMTKLALCVCLVLGKKSIDREVLRILKKILNDTSAGYQGDIIRLLQKYPDGLSRIQISNTLQISQTTTHNIIMDLHTFDVVERNDASNNSGIRGRKLHLWKLTQKIKNLMED